MIYIQLVVTQKLPKGEDGYKIFSIRVKVETVEKLEEVCKKSGRTRNELIGIFLEYAADNCEIEPR